MANALDEITGQVNPDGRDINVIATQLPATTGFGSVLFEIGIWALVPIIAIVCALVIPMPIETRVWIIVGGCAVGIISGLIFQYMKTKAQNYFQQLEQKIQAEASNIDNYMEQRVIILENLAGLVQKSIDLDKQVMESVAALRSGINNHDSRAALEAKANAAFRGLNLQVEAYPELKAHNAIAQAIQQNSYLQREITAARSVYNDRIYQWNRDIFDWPVKQIVAAKHGYTTRIPFTATADVKEEARKKFF